MARAIDGDALYQEFEAMAWYDNADRDLAEDMLLRMPTLTPPNEPLTCEGCKFEYEATDEAMCEQCIRSPAYRDYYCRPPEGEEDT